MGTHSGSRSVKPISKQIFEFAETVKHCASPCVGVASTGQAWSKLFWIVRSAVHGSWQMTRATHAPKRYMGLAGKGWKPRAVWTKVLQTKLNPIISSWLKWLGNLFAEVSKIFIQSIPLLAPAPAACATFASGCRLHAALPTFKYENTDCIDCRGLGWKKYMIHLYIYSLQHLCTIRKRRPLYTASKIHFLNMLFDEFDRISKSALFFEDLGNRNKETDGAWVSRLMAKTSDGKGLKWGTPIENMSRNKRNKNHYPWMTGITRASRITRITIIKTFFPW